MSNNDKANRIKDAIKSHGGYEAMSDRTGINSRTLKRMSSGETEPKFKDIITLSLATNLSCDYFAFGTKRLSVKSLEEESRENVNTITHQLDGIINDSPASELIGSFITIISDSINAAEKNDALPKTEEAQFLKLIIDSAKSSIDKNKATPELSK